MYRIESGEKSERAATYTEAERKFNKLAKGNPEEFTRLILNNDLMKIRSKRIADEWAKSGGVKEVTM